MNDTLLGKITSAKFGMVHDREFLFGLMLSFAGQAWGVSTQHTTNLSPNCKWDYPEQKAEFAISVIEKVHALLVSAKVNTVDELVGKPVEVVFEYNTIKSYRILEEVL